MPKTKTLIKNEEILAKKIILINAEGENLGEMTINEAMELAEEKELDLVQVQDIVVPFCKLMDVSKGKYTKQRKQKQSKSIKNKEIRFSMNTAIHDIKVKTKHVEKLLNKGCRIKIVLKNNNRRRGIDPKEMEDGLNAILETILCKFNKEPKIDKKINTWSIVITP